MADEAMRIRRSSKLHILMFPWMAIGHMTPYLHLSHMLAERGHKITFLLPNKAQLLLHPLNLHPSLVTFHPLFIPHVDGLPLGTETPSDTPISLTRFLTTALDLTRPQLDHIIAKLKPDFVFYDLAYWIPEITYRHRIKSVSYNVECAAILTVMVPARSECFRRDRHPPVTVEELGGGNPMALLHEHEVRSLLFMSQEYGSGGVTFFERINSAIKSADVVAIRSCREIEGKFCDYLSSQFEKPVLLTAPVLPDSTRTERAALGLDERWASWLGAHEPGSVIYCAFGTQCFLDKDQFQELLLGFELTGYPFFAALKPPPGCSAIEEALPEGFEERVRGKGVVYGGWDIQQPLILEHPSVGCFVGHCGFGSMWESLMGKPQIVLVPQQVDQILNTRILAGEMKVAVEVDKDESGWVSRESMCKAVKEAMDKESSVGCLIRENHAKWREVLGGPGFISGYVDNFVHQLENLLD